MPVMHAQDAASGDGLCCLCGAAPCSLPGMHADQHRAGLSVPGLRPAVSVVLGGVVGGVIG